MIKFVPVAIILTLIIISSSQPYDQTTLIPTLQQMLPNEPINEILSVIKIPYWGSIVSIEERGYYAFVEFLIRKGIHLITYGVLASSMLFITKKYLTVIIFIIVIALMDEAYQSTIGGRTASGQDVLLDFLGASLSLLLIYLIRKGKSKSNKRT